MHLLITRPEPDADAFRARLEALGHQVTSEPLLTIEHLPIAADALGDVAGLVVTSRNGLRALAASPAMATARQLPIIAVGPGTAALARELGFTRITEGSGTATELVPVIADAARALHGTLTHVRGEQVAVDLRSRPARARRGAARDRRLSGRAGGSLATANARAAGVRRHRRGHLDVAANGGNLRPAYRRRRAARGRQKARFAVPFAGRGGQRRTTCPGTS